MGKPKSSGDDFPDTDPTLRTPAPPYEEAFHDHPTESHSQHDFPPHSQSQPLPQQSHSHSAAPFHDRVSALIDSLGFNASRTRTSYKPLAQSSDEDVEAQGQPAIEASEAAGPALEMVRAGPCPNVHCKECTKLAVGREQRRCCLNATYAVLGMFGMLMFFGMIVAIVVVKAEHSHRR